MRRPRGFHRPGRLVVVALLLLVAMGGFATFGFGVVEMMHLGEPTWGWVALGGMAVFALARLGVFLLSRSLTCPLCHGPVMQERRCRKHADAFRLWPLSYRASAVLALLCTAAFRCMYCGTGFRMRK